MQKKDHKFNKTTKLKAKKLASYSWGFTLMEIVVATSIFAVVVVAMMSIFVLTLRLNRKSDALRQASQGSRNFIEFLTKEIRNGHIDYAVANGTVPLAEVSPCPYPRNANEISTPKYGRIRNDGISDWTLGLVNIDGDRECFYWSRADGTGNYTLLNGFTDFNSLFVRKAGVTQPQKLNPPNFTIDYLRFYVRPNRDPYTSSSNRPKIQPSVTMVIQLTTKLPTGEVVKIPYQTTISTNNYDIPAN